MLPPYATLLSTLLLAAGCQADTVEVGGVAFVPYQIEADAETLAAGDLDGDGHADLVAARHQLVLFYGDGTGRLERRAALPAGENPSGVALADLDEDGAVDMAVANHETYHLTVLLGDGTGAFAPTPASPVRINVAPHPHVVRAADLDGDGHLDLIVDHRQGEGLLVLRGHGDGTFATPGTLVGVGGDPYLGMAVGDLDGDGRLDLVTPNPREVGIRLGEDPARLAFRNGPAVAADTPFGVALADFNGDGRLDLVSASGEGSARVQFFWGDGLGGFVEADGSPLRLATGGKSIAVGDFNGDGIPDAVVTSYRSSDVLVVLGGAGALRTATLPAGEHPWAIAAADLNEDGIDDLVIADDANSRATVYLSHTRR